MIQNSLIHQGERFLKRKIESSLIKDLNTSKALLVLGSRRTGKTSLLKRLIFYLSKEKSINNRQIFYFDLENVIDLADLKAVENNPLSLLDFCQAKGADTEKKIYFFIDEVHYLDNPSSLLKLTYDHLQNIQIIASGSSTLQIKAKMKDSLVGRKHSYILHPLDFEEFLLFKKQDNLVSILKKNPKKILTIPSFKLSLQQYVEEFVVYGGYPEVVLAKTQNDKIVELSEIYSDYVRKDIKDFLRLKNLDKFNRLVKILSVNTANLINLQDLANDLDLSKPTIENYLFLLENTFTISRLSPFYRNKRKEIIEKQKIFFNDTGLRNLAINNFSSLEFRPDNGSLFENAVFGQLYKNLGLNEELHFWRTQAGAEVDFVKVKGLDYLPFEAKFGKINKRKLSSSLKNFMVNYQPKKIIIVNRYLYEKIRSKNLSLLFLPFFTLIKQQFL